MTHTLDEALKNLVKIGKIDIIFAEGQTYYYLEQKKYILSNFFYKGDTS